MAKNIKITETTLNPASHCCQAAEHCYWYETSKEASSVCSHRNELVCHLRREEVFGEKQASADQLEERASSV